MKCEIQANKKTNNCPKIGGVVVRCLCGWLQLAITIQNSAVSPACENTGLTLRATLDFPV